MQIVGKLQDITLFQAYVEHNTSQKIQRKINLDPYYNFEQNQTYNK